VPHREGGGPHHDHRHVRRCHRPRAQHPQRHQIAAAVLDAGAARLQVCDPDEEKLSDLLDRLAARGRGRVAVGPAPELERADVAVNATPLGLRADDPLPFDPASLPAGAVVADIIMQPRETPLLRAATAAGRPVHHGAHMLSHQLDLYREFFRLGEFE
ncbi:hypothetical protein ABZY04_39645, partial [Streptomyces sp. NPDC002922]